jgi:hypothetical protein
MESGANGGYHPTDKTQITVEMSPTFVRQFQRELFPRFFLSVCTIGEPQINTGTGLAFVHKRAQLPSPRLSSSERFSDWQQ